MVRTLTFNRVHKNGWLSYRLVGVPGAVYVDKRMLSAETLATPPQTLEIDINGMVEPGADATQAAAEKAEKQRQREEAKAAKAAASAAKAAERLQKLQDKAKATAERAAAALAKAQAQAGATSDAPPAE